MDVKLFVEGIKKDKRVESVVPRGGSSESHMGRHKLKVSLCFKMHATFQLK